MKKLEYEQTKIKNGNWTHTEDATLIFRSVPHFQLDESNKMMDDSLEILIEIGESINETIIVEE